VIPGLVVNTTLVVSTLALLHFINRFPVFLCVRYYTHENLESRVIVSSSSSLTMVAVHVRRRERASRISATSDCSSTLSFDEFKALAAERKHDFGEFETQTVNAAEKTTHSTATTNTTADTSVELLNSETSTQMPSLDGAFYYEDRSEPVEETLSFAGRGREVKEDLRDDSPNVVEQFMDSESDNQYDSISRHDLHSDETEEHGNNNRSVSSLPYTESKPASSHSFRSVHIADIPNNGRANSKIQKSILRSQGRGPLRSNDDRSFSLRSPRSSFRSASSSFRSSENGSVSATSQKSYLQPIARIRVTVTDDSISTSAKKSTASSKGDTGSKVAIGDASDLPKIPGRAFGDEITAKGTAMISANKGYNHPRENASPEELSEASSIVLSGSYSSFSASGGSQGEDPQEGVNDASSSTANHRRTAAPYSAQETAKALETPLEQTYSIDSMGNKREKRSPHKVQRFKVGQRIKNGIRKSVKAIKYIFTGAILVKGFYYMKKASARITAGMRRPFALISNPEGARGGDSLTSKTTMIDDELAQSLIKNRMGDESSVVRASRYVTTGRELLKEAAKLKDGNPTACTILTKKAHTYAYAARQVAKKALIARKTAANERQDMQIFNNVSREIVDDEEETIIPEEKNAWKRKLEEIKLFNLEDLLPSCFNACGTCGADKSALEVDQALEILAKISEEEVQGSKSSVPGSNDLRTTDNNPSLVSRAVAKNRQVSNLESTVVYANFTFVNAEGLSMSKSQSVAIKDLVTELRSFYEADQTINGNGITTNSTIEEDRSLFTTDTWLPGGLSVEMRTIKNNDTREWSNVTRSLFNADDEEEKDAEAENFEQIPRIMPYHVPKEVEHIEEKEYHCDTSHAYSTSLKGDGSSCSHSYATDGASLTSGTKVSHASTSGRSSSRSSSKVSSKHSKETEEICQTTIDVGGVSTSDSLFLFESSTHSRSSRSRFEKWALRRKGKC
jgi:trimeric autotransporter adhesin